MSVWSPPTGKSALKSIKGSLLQHQNHIFISQIQLINTVCIFFPDVSAKHALNVKMRHLASGHTVACLKMPIRPSELHADDSELKLK